MRHFTVYLSLSFILLQVCCSPPGERSDATTAAKKRKLTKEELFWQHLREKADSAFFFCEKNDMNLSFCFLVDMSVHSGKKRFFIWSFETDTVIGKSLCAHGYGMNSTVKKPVFSNIPESYTSSLGKYKTGIRSYSNWGIHVHYKLHGLESTNDKAFERTIVLHSHNPIPEMDISPFHLPLGYSQGCPVIDNATMRQIDELLKTVKKPSLLWIYTN